MPALLGTAAAGFGLAWMVKPSDSLQGYAEARMTEAATELLSGITEDAVDFRPTYNEENEEPTVLPGAFPNLLANGSTGIAVGMATSIPPHNVAELAKACLLLIDRPDATVEDLLTKDPHPDDDDENMVRGPDFPTGGIIVDRWPTIVEAYKTGRGSFRVRAKWAVEDGDRAGDAAEETRAAGGRVFAAGEDDAFEEALANRMDDEDDERVASLSAEELERRFDRIPPEYAVWFARNVCPSAECGGTLAPPNDTATHMTCNACGFRRTDEAFYALLSGEQDQRGGA